MDYQLFEHAQECPTGLLSTSSSSTIYRHPNSTLDIPVLLAEANNSLYENRAMQRTPTILNSDTSCLPISIRPSAMPAIPPFLLSAQQYELPTQITNVLSTSQCCSYPHRNHSFLPLDVAERQFRRLRIPATCVKRNTHRSGFLRDQYTLLPHMKNRFGLAIEEVFTTLEELRIRVRKIFTQSFDQLRDIIVSGENILSLDEALCAEFMLDGAIEGINPYTGPGTNQEVHAQWKEGYRQYKSQRSETRDRNLTMEEMFAIPITPSSVPLHLHARNTIWQINSLHSLQIHRVLVIMNLRSIRDSMDLSGKGKDVFPLPEVGFGAAKRRFTEKQNWPRWDTFMGGLGYLTCAKEEWEHWIRLWEAFNVEVEVARRAGQRKKTLGRLWGVKGEGKGGEKGMGETDHGTGAGSVRS